jgi:acetolactate synthase-1/2/3 large subunit
MMNSQEMETAVRLGLHVIVLVLRDDAYGMIKWKQAHMHFTDYGLDYGNPDFVAYARSYGAKGWRIDDTSELLPMIERCLAEPDIHLIEVPVDYSLNDEKLNKDIRNRSQQL